MSKRNNDLICLIGIDGSGKTSHISQMKTDFNKMGISCRHVRCGASVRFLTFPIYILSKILGYCKKYKNSDRHIHTSKYPDVYKNKFLKKIWPWLVYFDMLILIFLRIKLNRLCGFIILSDRSVHDVLVEIMVVTKDHEFYKTKLGEKFLKLDNFNAIMLDVDEIEAFKRKTDIPDIEFLRIRKQLFRKISSDLNIPIIDVNRPFSVVHDDIINQFEEICSAFLKSSCYHNKD